MAETVVRADATPPDDIESGRSKARIEPTHQIAYSASSVIRGIDDERHQVGLGGIAQSMDLIHKTVRRRPKSGEVRAAAPGLGIVHFRRTNEAKPLNHLAVGKSSV